MAQAMTHQERVRTALAGGPVDRPPVSMWRHFYGQETTAQGLAEAMLSFQRRFDWDFMKVNPRASYHGEGWGLRMRYEGDRAPQVAEAPVQKPEDWLKLGPLAVDEGVLGEQLRALEIIAHGLHGEVPFVMTVFTPLSIAARLVPSEELFLRHLREHPEKVAYALEVVTETFTRFARGCLERGAWGLFYATTSWATYTRLTDQEYARWGRPYDLKLLQALPPAPFHILHVCRERNMLTALADYPVQAFNWDTHGAGNPALSAGKALLAKEAAAHPPRTAMGGIDHRLGLAQSAPGEVRQQVRKLRGAMGPSSWMVGPGCTFPPAVPETNLMALREAIEEH